MTLSFLHYGSLFWPQTGEPAPRYPSLTDAVDCRVLIIGGGMSGSLIGYTLARSGISAVLIDQSRIASGSTSANTGLLQYSNDIMLSELAQQIGDKDAVTFYRACKHAVEKLCQIAENLTDDVQFKRRSSLYYASTPDDVPALRAEYEMLNRHGLDTEWWTSEQIRSAFPFHKDAALVTHGDAEINPFRFASALARDGSANGLRIYENTTLQSIEGQKGNFLCKTETGQIQAELVIYAVGYSPEVTGSKLVQANLNQSYAIVTEPVESLAVWHERWLIWESARPYLYVRTTPENRIVIGGLDEEIRTPVTTEQDLHNHSLRLLNDANALFPSLNLRIAYEWCATFGESQDQLPWLGEDPKRPGHYLALGYGGNGTVYSLLAAEMIRDELLGYEHPVRPIVRLDRPTAKSGAH